MKILVKKKEIEMETREELLEGLSNAVSIMGQFSNAQQQLDGIRSQYRSTRANVKWGKLAKTVFTFWIICCVVGLFVAEKNVIIFNVVQYVVYTAGFYAVMTFYYKAKNKKITADNEQIVENNQRLKVKEQEVIDNIQQLQESYRQYVSSWYPENYCYVDAAEFFYNTIKNYRADTLKEAINLYETTLHQQRIENNQKQSIKQQKLNNLLSVGSIIMQGAQLGEMSRHNANVEFQMQQSNRNLSDIKSKL